MEPRRNRTGAAKRVAPAAIAIALHGLFLLALAVTYGQTVQRWTPVEVSLIRLPFVLSPPVAKPKPVPAPRTRRPDRAQAASPAAPKPLPAPAPAPTATAAPAPPKAGPSASANLLIGPDGQVLLPRLIRCDEGEKLTAEEEAACRARWEREKNGPTYAVGNSEERRRWALEDQIRAAKNPRLRDILNPDAARPHLTNRPPPPAPIPFADRDEP